MDPREFLGPEMLGFRCQLSDVCESGSSQLKECHAPSAATNRASKSAIKYDSSIPDNDAMSLAKPTSTTRIV